VASAQDASLAAASRTLARFFADAERSDAPPDMREFNAAVTALGRLRQMRAGAKKAADDEADGNYRNGNGADNEKENLEENENGPQESAQKGAQNDDAKGEAKDNDNSSAESDSSANCLARSIIDAVARLDARRVLARDQATRPDRPGSVHAGLLPGRLPP
jgi:hypothetical protein